MRKTLQDVIDAAILLRSKITELSAKGIEINSVLVNDKDVSVSVGSGIEKAAGITGATLEQTPTGRYLCFDIDPKMHFGQKSKNFKDKI